MSTPPAAVRTGAPRAGDPGTGIETLVARLLVIGTWVAVALVLAGVLAMLATGVDPLVHGERPVFDPAGIPADLLALRPTGFLWAGLLAVLLLPIGRVVVSGVGFLVARDRRLALVSLAVLVVVVVSIVAALGLEG
ncbi:MAG: DUF1634 domain-containing protein [Chloroflexota bacterium]